MDSYYIGISGLNAAQEALDVIGNNIANAATEGYHRQRIELTPERMSQVGQLILGGGVEVSGITRLLDNFLEQELLRQQSSLEQTSQELDTLRIIESAFGELSSEDGGLNAAIDKFFNALQDLSAHPGESIWQNQAVTAAKTVASQFRALGDFLNSLETRIRLEADDSIDEVNALISQIAELNSEIENIEMIGGHANNSRDQRDQCITELSKLIGVETQAREFGVVDVHVGGIPVVAGSLFTELEVGLNANNELGIAIADSSAYVTDMQGGRLGGLLSLKNELISDIHDDLDDLAKVIIQQINQYHVQMGVDLGGRRIIKKWSMTDEDLADFESPITSGSVFIRVTDTTVPGTTTITRDEIDIASDLPANPTLSDFADYITTNITGLTASVVSSKLHIQAETNYKFDFLPAVLSSPTASTLTGGTPPTISVSGIYTGTTNDTFRFTVSGAGSVGNGTLTLEVKGGGGAGDVVTTLNIGSDYAAGDWLDVGNGIKVSLSTGDFGAGDNFDVDAFASTDTSGVLAAAGMNTFFSGNSAFSMAVCSDIANSPSRVATSLGAGMTDNANAVRMTDLRDEAMSSLNSLTAGEFYRQLVTDVGQQLYIAQMRQDNTEIIVQNFTDQRSKISGVDINDEAAQMLVFEQMFQAMAKYLSTVQSVMSSVMEIL
jgi:flagellar hook-associated protein FlgK